MYTVLSQLKYVDTLPDFEQDKVFDIYIYNKNNKFNDKIKLDHWYIIEVKSYMCEQSKNSHDFMILYNNNNPMPCNRMSGKVIKENRSMIYMKLYNSNTRDTWEGWIVKNAILKYKEINNEQANQVL